MLIYGDWLSATDAFEATIVGMTQIMPRPSRRAVLFAMATVFGAAIVLSAGCISREIDPTSATAAPISLQTAERGKALRRVIDEEYQRLRQARQIVPVNRGGNSIVGIIRPFIHAGMPFEEAEQTLRAAGFVVQRRSKSLLSPRLQVIAKISPYATSLLGLNGRTNVAVFLEPVTQDDWSTVGRVVDAGFSTVFL